MPKDTTSTTGDQFVMITIDELQTLTRLNAPARAIECLIALRSFAWDGRSCYPSLKKLGERMGLTNSSMKQTVSKALKWLEDNSLIERHSRTSKERFVITTPNERLANTVTSKSAETVIEVDASVNRSTSPISPQRGLSTNKRNRRYSPMEKRQRRWERKAKAGLEEVALQKKQQEEEQAKSLTEWQLEHRQAQDAIINLNGTSSHLEKMALMIARWSFETSPELWTYEPAPINEIGLEMATGKPIRFVVFSYAKPRCFNALALNVGGNASNNWLGVRSACALSMRLCS